MQSYGSQTIKEVFDSVLSRGNPSVPLNQSTALFPILEHIIGKNRINNWQNLHIGSLYYFLLSCSPTI